MARFAATATLQKVAVHAVGIPIAAGTFLPCLNSTDSAPPWSGNGYSASREIPPPGARADPA